MMELLAHVSALSNMDLPHSAVIAQLITDAADGTFSLSPDDKPYPHLHLRLAMEMPLSPLATASGVMGRRCKGFLVRPL
jgi:hypothetical protein